MGKSKKLKPSQIGSKLSLDQDIENTKFVKSKNRNKVRNRQDEEEEYVESKISNKILKIARAQQRELLPSINAENTLKPNLSKADSDSDSEDDIDNLKVLGDISDNIKINDDEEMEFQRFMSSDPKPISTLADIMREKLTEKKTEIESHFTDNASNGLQDLDPRFVSIYEACGEVLKRYRSGKLPKLFKALPKRNDWETLLDITDPPGWSAAAMYQATRIFASNLNETDAHKFFAWVLLPRIRDDIQEYKKLNFHLYEALKKALHKPTAFMTGIIFPLLESGDCTLREAIIVGSVLQNFSVPALHSATAIIKIAGMDYTGANSIFLRILLDKKYSLPRAVVDVVFEHFKRFQQDEREMPVLWHQSLITFVQRYKSDISDEQRHEIFKLIKKHHHNSISREIERELRHTEATMR